MKKHDLHNIKGSGFNVPKDYFKTLGDRVFSQIKLKELADNSGFKTPDNYFASLEEKI